MKNWSAPLLLLSLFCASCVPLGSANTEADPITENNTIIPDNTTSVATASVSSLQSHETLSKTSISTLDLLINIDSATTQPLITPSIITITIPTTATPEPISNKSASTKVEQEDWTKDVFFTREEIEKKYPKGIFLNDLPLAVWPEINVSGPGQVFVDACDIKDWVGKMDENTFPTSFGVFLGDKDNNFCYRNKTTTQRVIDAFPKEFPDLSPEDLKKILEKDMYLLHTFKQAILDSEGPIFMDAFLIPRVAKINEFDIDLALYTNKNPYTEKTKLFKKFNIPYPPAVPLTQPTATPQQ